MTLTRELLRFGLVGIIGLAVDVTLLALLREPIGIYAARLASFLGAATTTWILNRRFTFADRSAGIHICSEYVRYLGLMLGGGLVNLAAYSILASRFSQSPLWLSTYVCVGSLLGMVVNFTGATRWLFRHKG